MIFLLKYWYFFTIATVLGFFGFYYYNSERQIEQFKKQTIEMRIQIAMGTEAIKSRDIYIELQNKTIEISKNAEKKEKISEKHYHTTVVNNKKVVKEYLNKTNKTTEDIEKHYNWLNSKWEKIQK